MRYAEARIDRPGGAPVHLCYPHERPTYPDAFRHFLSESPSPAPAEVLELENVYLRNGRDWACLYDRDGRRIDATALLRYRDDLTPEFWRAAPTMEIPQKVVEIAEPVVYGSVFFQHWGHFLLESAARLWARRENPQLAALPTVYTWFAPSRFPAIADFLAAADARALEVAAAPCVRLARCFAPSPSFAHAGFASPRHLATPHAVARRLGATPARDARPVYLARSQVTAPLAGRAQVLNEAELETQLAGRGVRIVHMQQMTLAEQVATMNAHGAFIGLWGSALHNTLFRLSGEEAETFVLMDYFERPTNFLLVDAIVGNRAHYLKTVRPEGGDLVIDVPATLDYLGRAGAI